MSDYLSFCNFIIDRVYDKIQCNEYEKNIIRNKIERKHMKFNEEERRALIETLAEIIEFRRISQNISKPAHRLSQPTDRLKNTNIHTTKRAGNTEISVHEILNNELKQQTRDISTGEFSKKPDERYTHINVHSIFGTQNIMDIMKYFNPQALIGTLYIVLDRRYQQRNNDNFNKFTWKCATVSDGFDDQSVLCTSNVKNIIGIVARPFRFPYTENALTFSRRISMTIEELNNQAFLAWEKRRRFHFLFQASQETGASYNPYILGEVDEDISEFWFNKKISELNSITISFGNPFQKLTLHPDLLPATITADGIQTQLTFSQPHYMNIGERVYIEGFTTTNTTADYVEIQLLNDEFGLLIESVTSTTALIDIDISGLSGTISNNPYNIYLDGKRFIIPLEIKYMKSNVED